MSKRIFISMSLLALLTILLSVVALTFIMFQQLSEDMERELKNQALYLRVGVSESGADYLAQIKGEDRESRITLIDPQGNVLFDNRAPAETMENHGDRPEVKDALAAGEGYDVRLSQTVGRHTYYYALRLDDGNILRVASTTDSAIAALANSAPVIAAIVLLILGVALVYAKHRTKRIVRPINDIDLENPIENDVYDELAPLLTRIHQQKNSIDRQIQELKRRRQQFDEITENMAEGLVVMDDAGNILSINKSALRFLGRDSEQREIARQIEDENIHLSVLNRNLSLQKMVNTALTEGPVKEIFQVEEKRYQVWATPIIEEGRTRGAILLILDVTEQIRSEQIRKEFTANVSHELKTPLTAISGYAELMRDGKVEQQDVSRFVGKIYDESAGLVALVEDIIRLSQLDEKNVPSEMEKVDLLDLAMKVKEKLDPLAKLKKVRMEVVGDRVEISGVPKLIEEMLANLCDNAIKYNKENGSVRIVVAEEDGAAILSVEDTGIGIPAEHHSRIFERFYRVDKSHSKQTGGTGLGLSIVKHIAGFHNAHIEMDSVPDKGTRIAVKFPNL